MTDFSVFCPNGVSHDRGRRLEVHVSASSGEGQGHRPEPAMPIVKKIPHLKRYVINVSRPSADGTSADIGGIAELWFESLGVMKTALSTAEAKHARTDIQNFTEVARNISGLFDEHIVVKSPSPGWAASVFGGSHP